MCIYLKNIVSKTLRSALTKIRVPSHSLRTHTGRYEREIIERQYRYCELCNNGHFYLSPLRTFENQIYKTCLQM